MASHARDNRRGINLSVTRGYSIRGSRGYPNPFAHRFVLGSYGCRPTLNWPASPRRAETRPRAGQGLVHKLKAFTREDALSSSAYR